MTGTENEYELRLASERNAKQRSRHKNFSVVVAATLRGNFGGPTETITAALDSKKHAQMISCGAQSAGGAFAYQL